MNKRYTRQDVEEMKRLFYEEKTPLVEIAELFDSSYSYICFLINKDPYSKNRLDAEGPKIAPRKLTKEERRQIVNLSKTLLPSTLAFRFRVSTRTITNVLRAHGGKG